MLIKAFTAHKRAECYGLHPEDTDQSGNLAVGAPGEQRQIPAGTAGLYNVRGTFSPFPNTPMGRTIHQLRCTAHHEAAHFVAWFDLLSDGMLFVDSVSIEPGPGFTGRLVCDGDLGLGVRAIDDAIVMVYAGREAHLRLAPAEVDAADREAAGDERFITDLWGYSNTGNLDVLRQRASEFVAKHWDDIVALACALLKHRTLSTDDARLVIEAARGDEYAKESLRARFDDDGE